MTEKSFMSDITSSVSGVVDNAKSKATNAYNNLLGNSTVGAGRGSINPPFAKVDNVYTHDNTKFEKLELNTQFIPNILDNYDAVTYHWKLFITDPDSSSTGKIFDPSNQTIIAESGISDLTIDKVEIRAVTTPSTETGTGVSTNIKFEIVEPSGAGLIDKLFYQSIALGIANWAVMPIYLQLQFKNRNPDTSEVDDGEIGSLSALKWLWPLSISSTKANVTEVGTRYEFVCIVYNDIALTNARATLSHNVTLTKLENVEKALAELQDKLNSDQMFKIIHNYSIPDVFKIVVDPTIALFKITPINKNTNPRRSDNFVEFGNKDATFSSGTSIDKVIDTLLAQTNEYQALMRVDIPDKVDEPMRTFWRIVVETRPLTFDPRRRDMAKEYTIYVIEYDLGIPNKDTTEKLGSVAAERNRIKAYINKCILKKKYNYIFTGLNDQIINFDLTINNAYATALSRFDGIYSNPSMNDKGVVTHDHAAEEAAVKSAVTKAISFHNNASTSNNPDSKKATAEAKKAIDTAIISDDDKKRYTVLLENSQPENRLNYLKEITNRGGITNDGKFRDAKYNAVNLAKPVTEKITQQQYNFISNVDTTSPAAVAAFNSYVEYVTPRLRPIARIETLQDRQIGLGIEADSDSGIQKLSSMYSVALHSGLDSSFQSIKLTIKGDPFWLFPQPITDTSTHIFNTLKPAHEAIEWIKKAHFKYKDSVNYYGTDNFIVIRFRSPRIYNLDENPDSSNPNTDIETFSGVYRVVEIINKFEVGKFRQELSCTLDPHISLLNVMDQIETNAATKDTATSPKDLMTQNSIPSTAIKNDLQSIAETNRLSTAGVSLQSLAETGRLASAGIINKVDQTLAETNRLMSAGESALSKIKSNIPTSIPSSLPGLPNTFF